MSQHTQTKQIINRLSRAIGHMESIKRMVEQERSCSDVLIQLSAVRAAINRVAAIVLQDHIRHCVIDAANQGDEEVLISLDKAIKQFLK